MLYSICIFPPPPLPRTFCAFVVVGSMMCLRNNSHLRPSCRIPMRRLCSEQAVEEHARTIVDVPFLSQKCRQAAFKSYLTYIAQVKKLMLESRNRVDTRSIYRSMDITSQGANEERRCPEEPQVLSSWICEAASWNLQLKLSPSCSSAIQTLAGHAAVHLHFRLSS